MKDILNDYYRREYLYEIKGIEHNNLIDILDNKYVRS